MTPRVLIVFGTSYGQTEKIANRIAASIQRRGIAVELCNAATSQPSLSAEQYSGVMVGSSVIAHGIQPAIRRFVHDNVATLNRLPSAFYMVSASAGSTSEGGRMAAQKILDEFVTKSGWTPVLSASVAGAVNYTRYNFLLRWYMKRASAKGGGSTDTSRDHEYTDWAQVDQFAAAFATAMSEAVESAHEPALGA